MPPSRGEALRMLGTKAAQGLRYKHLPSLRIHTGRGKEHPEACTVL